MICFKIPGKSLMSRSSRCPTGLVFTFVLLVTNCVFAQQPDSSESQDGDLGEANTAKLDGDSPAQSQTGIPAVSLVDRQGSVTDRYAKLEQLLLRLADMESAENPDRSALLRRAAKMSRDKFVLTSMRAAGDAIENEQFKKAVESQESASDQLKSILKLLQSEDRSKRIRDERERYKKLIADLKRNLEQPTIDPCPNGKRC